MPEVPFPPAAAVAASDPVADPTIKTGPYKYRPLATDKAEIRLLRVTASQADSDVVDCNLIHVNLDNKFSPLSRFKALSYTWGEPQFDESIQVDGHKFPVTKNLKEALLSLRKDPDPNIDRPYHLAAPSVWYWWIDAVCINQADIAERNSQVAVMRRIYHRAEGVQVWLGEEADDSEATFKLAVELEKDPPRRGPGVPAPPPLVATDDERRKNWKALAAIFARSWWQRAWVRQEV
ncbi:heterokaryon incompatibility protein-domain-containing protein, partial [Rhexocercosporidium sp. MPI-PUGE-AT-0058]